MDGDSSSDEAAERDDATKYKGTSRPPVKLPVKSSRPKVPVTSGKNSTPAAKATSSAAVPPRKPMTSTGPVPPAKLNKSATANSSSESDAPLAARQQKSTDSRIPKRSAGSTTTNPASKPSTPRGMGARRGKSSYQNVFARRSSPKGRGRSGITLVDNASDPTREKAHFQNMHLLRKAALGSRDKADRAPDVAVVGGLFKAGDTPPVGPPLRPIRKISDALPQPRNYENEEETDRPHIPSSTISQTTLPKNKTTCYYWHHNKGRSNACSKGYLCDYAHSYGEGYPIAEPPPSARTKELSRNKEGSFEEVNTSVPQKQEYQGTYRCFHYVKKGNCRLGDNCTKLHSDDKSIPIAPMKKINELCPYWLNGHCRKTAEDCSYVHGNPDEIRASQRTKVNETCQYWLSGHCRKTADECSRIHEYLEDIRAPTHVDFEILPNVQGQNPTVRQERLKPFCKRLQQTGYCKFGLKCNFRHEHPEAERVAEPVSKPETTNREAPKKSVSFVMDEPMDLCEEPLPIASYDTNQLELPQNNEPPPPPPPTESPTRSKPKRNKISFGDYSRKMAFNDGARAKKFSFGGDGTTSLVLDIGDMGKASGEPCGIFLTSIKEITLDQKITVQDLKAQYSAFHKRPGTIALEGNLSQRSENDSVETELIDKVVSFVRHQVCGLVGSSQGFNILVIPARSDEWSFLNLPICPRDVRLRYLVFQTDLNATACLHISGPESPVLEKATAAAAAMDYENTISEIVHRLDMQRIAPVNPYRRYAFFLIFPDTEERIANFIANWLKETHPSCKLYTSDTLGAWDLFLAGSEYNFNNGVIILHGSLSTEVDIIPLVQKTLLPAFTMAKRRQFNWWSISDGLPETHTREEKDRGAWEAVPLLPHGAAILLTQSFFVAEPQKAYDLLKWFFGRIDNDRRHKPGKMGSPSPWKIVLPFNVVEYTHDLACAKDAESTKFMEDNRDKPSKEADASRLGLGYATCELRFKIYAYLADLKHLGVIDKPEHVWPRVCVQAGEIRDEYNSPVIYAAQHVYTHDEIDLVYWFAWWSSVRVDTYRKFIVLGTNSLSRHKLKRLVEVKVGEGIPEEPVHRDTSLVSPPPEPPAAILNLQKSRRLQKSATPDGVVAENGGHTHLRDGDVDAQILELIGNESSKHPQLRLSTLSLDVPQTSPQYSPQFSAHSTSSGIPENGFGAPKAPIKFSIFSKSGSKPASRSASASPTPPVHATHVKVDGSFQDEWQKKREGAEMEWKEKTYEHTTSWFRNMKASPEREGILWEHLYVGSWDMVWPYIGYKPS